MCSLGLALEVKVDVLVQQCQGRTSGRASITLVAIRGFTTAPTTMGGSKCTRQQCQGSAARGPRPCQSCRTSRSPAAHAIAEGLSTAPTTKGGYVQAGFASPAL
eukprot:6253113-Amphidinium_carterae.1